MTEPAIDRFGPLLRRLRLVAGLSQEELAERSGLSGRGISALETGYRATPRPETVRLLADALGLDAAARAALVAAARPELAAARPGGAPVGRGPPLALPLPVPPTRLVGREQEVAALCARLRREEVRLLTLTGPGGVGKTRLALAAADELAGTRADGVCWIDLAPLADPALLLPTVARALGVRESVDQPLDERLRAALRPCELLLLMDNCEHLVTAVAALVGDLLAACPRLAVLATSRERLRLRGEQELAVPPLAVPAPVADSDPASVAGLAGVAAVRLFVERAAEVAPDFALNADNAAAVAAVCTRLDGLPLALELAAARVKVLSPVVLLARLELRLPLLTDGPRDLPARQRTVRDAIAWSYDLLSPEEQALFQRLAVFAGGFTLAAAEVVAGGATDGGTTPLAVLSGVGALVDKSLLRRDATPDGEPRFGMLETVREFGLERLAASAEAEATRRCHALYFLELTERIEPELLGAGQAAALARLEVDRDNHRAALAWLEQAGETDHFLRLAGASGPFWDIHGPLGEGREWLERALARADAAPSPALAEALAWVGLLARAQGDHGRAAALEEKSLVVARATGDARAIADALHSLGQVVVSQGDYDRAAALYEEALALYRGLGGSLAAFALVNLGVATAQRGEAERAGELLETGLAEHRARGNTWGVGFALRALGDLARTRGDHAEAIAHFRGCLVAWNERGYPRGIAYGLIGLAAVAADGGQPERAARLLGAADILRERFGCALWATERAAHEAAVGAARAALGEATFAAAFAAGCTLPLDRALAEAFAVALDPAPTSDPGPPAADSPPGSRPTWSDGAAHLVALVIGAFAAPAWF
jgi:predicted ATPase/transcriptional regulator with XRE-family HTH domain